MAFAQKTFPALRRRPTGWPDRPPVEHNVEIISFVFGVHDDALGYGRRAETVLAIFMDDNGCLRAAPINQFRLILDEPDPASVD